ncbi:MAG: hypothetical protein ACLFTN_06980 [Phycisphaerae bacterium]
MPRYTRIQSASFAGEALPLAVSAVVARRCEPLGRSDDLDAHPSSIQTRPLGDNIELTLRDVAIADGLAIGSQGTLVIEIASADGVTPGRSIRLSGAVLTRVETRYAQDAPAVAVLRFVCESPDGTTDPFHAEDQS